MVLFFKGPLKAQERYLTVRANLYTKACLKMENSTEWESGMDFTVKHMLVRFIDIKVNLRKERSKV